MGSPYITFDAIAMGALPPLLFHPIGAARRRLWACCADFCFQQTDISNTQTSKPQALTLSSFHRQPIIAGRRAGKSAENGSA
jgi:hypothetical protein